MEFTNYWQQFEHTGRVEDYLNYLQSAEGDRTSDALRDIRRENCRAEGRTDFSAGEDGSCRNPCM